MKMRFNPLVALLLILTAGVVHPAGAEENDQKAKFGDVKVLGLELASADLNSVRRHLWDIGGFLQADTTVRQRNIDKFYPWSRLRDSYYLEFRYNHAGNVTAFKRLYRPYSTAHSNRRSALTTREVALKLISDLGQPTRTVRKGWGGTAAYSSFLWEDDTMKILVDREGSERLGNVFIEYTVKSQSPYEVARTETGAANPINRGRE